MPEELLQFLVEAKKQTYALGDQAKTVKEKDGSTSLTFELGDYLYHDNYFGGEPFGGREIVFYRHKPLMIMVYYGRVLNSRFNVQEIYSFLQKFLSKVPFDYPYRGPKEFMSGGYLYKNNYQGEIDNFSGLEAIYKDKVKVYEASYLGGLVDQQR